MDNSFSLTVARVAEPGKIAAKRITPEKTIDYDLVTWWHFSTARLATLEDIAAFLNVERRGAQPSVSLSGENKGWRDGPAR